LYGTGPDALSRKTDGILKHTARESVLGNLILMRLYIFDRCAIRFASTGIRVHGIVEALKAGKLVWPGPRRFMRKTDGI